MRSEIPSVKLFKQRRHARCQGRGRQGYTIHPWDSLLASCFNITKDLGAVLGSTWIPRHSRWEGCLVHWLVWDRAQLTWLQGRLGLTQVPSWLSLDPCARETVPPQKPAPFPARCVSCTIACLAFSCPAHCCPVHLEGQVHAELYYSEKSRVSLSCILKSCSLASGYSVIQTLPSTSTCRPQIHYF